MMDTWLCFDRWSIEERKKGSALSINHNIQPPDKWKIELLLLLEIEANNYPRFSHLHLNQIISNKVGSQ